MQVACTYITNLLCFCAFVLFLKPPRETMLSEGFLSFIYRCFKSSPLIWVWGEVDPSSCPDIVLAQFGKFLPV